MSSPCGPQRSLLRIRPVTKICVLSKATRIKTELFNQKQLRYFQQKRPECTKRCHLATVTQLNQKWKSKQTFSEIIIRQKQFCRDASIVSKAVALFQNCIPRCSWYRFHRIGEDHFCPVYMYPVLFALSRLCF